MTSSMEYKSELSSVESHASRSEFYVLLTILSLLCALGTAGNALVLFVFSRKTNQLVSTLFIIALAFVDFVTCLIVIPLTLYMESVTFYVDVDVLCKFYHFMITSNIPFSALVMVAIAADRYLCICHPFVRAFSMPRAKLTVAVLGVAATCIGVCVALMYGVHPKVEPGDAASLRDVTGGLHDVTANPDDVTTGIYIRTGKSGLDDVDQTTMEINALIGENTAEPANFAAIADGRDPHSLFHGIVSPENPSWSFQSISTAQNASDAGDESGDDAGALATQRQCTLTYAILSPEFVSVYQKCYTALFLVCFLAVVTLYVLIYRSVLRRRNSRRRRHRSVSLRLTTDETYNDTVQASTPPVTITSSPYLQPPPNNHRGGRLNLALEPPYSTEPDGATESLDFSTMEQSVVGEFGPHAGVFGPPAVPMSRSESCLARRDRIANLKTAAMLFVVTLVFIVTFLPAFLMMLQLIPYNMIVFYSYFANNVANPVIYSFMNRNFRENLVRLFCGPRGLPANLGNARL